MRLVRFGPAGEEQPGLLEPDGTLRSLAGKIPDIGGDSLLPAQLDRLRSLDPGHLPRITVPQRLGPCVQGVGKLVGIGLNYRDHASESGMTIPSEPVVFFKATSAITGPHDNIVIPPGSQKTDWEVELGVVIGETARYAPVERALEHVAGYCIVNDVSERALQLEGTGQWVKGKSCDTFAPLGPWLVTRDEIADPQDLQLWLEVDGVRLQDGTTRTMIFGVAELVSYVSRHMSLHPGDIICTGTPAGVGLGLKPPRYLQPGNVVRLGIDGLGEQRQEVIAYTAQPDPLEGAEPSMA